jgi:hypothetical protein
MQRDLCTSRLASSANERAERRSGQSPMCEMSYDPRLSVLVSLNLAKNLKLSAAVQVF